MMISVVVGIFTSFFMLGTKSFWNDEVFSIIVSKSEDLFTTLWLKEFNMWAYYVVQEFWLRLGDSEIVVRLPSAVFAVISVIFIHKIGEKLFNKKVGLISSLLAATNVFFVLYAQDARSYSMALLMSSISTYFFIEIIKYKKKWMGMYVFFSVLSVYTHVFSGLIILSHFVSLFVLSSKRSKKDFLVAGSLMGIMFIPLLIAPSFHSNQIGWINRPSIKSLIGTYYILAGDFIPSFIATMLIMIIGFKLNSIKMWEVKLLGILLTLPTLLTFGFSELIIPIYQSRYFIILLPAFSVLLAYCISTINRKVFFWMALGVIIGTSITRLYFWYSKDNQHFYTIANDNPDWHGVNTYILQNSTPGNAVTFFKYYGYEVFNIYNNESDSIAINIATGPYSVNDADNTPEPNLKLIKSFVYPEVWLVLSGEYDFGQNSVRHADIEASLSEKYDLVETIAFNELKLERFKLKLN